MRIAILTIIPNNLLAELLLSHLGILHSAGLEILVLSGRMFPLGITTVAKLNWKMRLPLGCFGVLMPLNQQPPSPPIPHQKKEANVLAGVIDPDNQKEIGLLLYYGIKDMKSRI